MQQRMIPPAVVPMMVGVGDLLMRVVLLLTIVVLVASAVSEEHGNSANVHDVEESLVHFLI